ncbi:MAG TPA: hypothetical protein VKY89_11260, partial [Thermoanaerobaculia bacterium]|nr:hypothetical protein [Thermoanaerobaculia bacterium]
MSLTLAGAGLALALALAGAAQRQIAISPQDLVAWTWLQAAPGEGWVMTGGRVRGPLLYSAWFFVQPASGRWLRVRRAAVGYPQVAFSADGRTAVWPEQEAPQSSRDELLRLDLDRAGAAPVRTAIQSATPNSGIAVSPHGTRVAVVEKQRVSIFDLAGGRLLAAHSFDGAVEVTAEFTGEDSVRLLVNRFEAASGGAIDVYDFDAGARQPVKRSSIPEIYYQPSLSPRTDRLVVNRPAIGASVAVAKVFDLTTGRRLAELGEPGAEVEARYLPDGRLAETVRAKTGTQLMLLDGDGRPQAGSPRYRFPAGTRVLPLQASPDHLLVREVLPAASRDRERRSYLVLDLSQGTART